MWFRLGISVLFVAFVGSPVLAQGSGAPARNKNSFRVTKSVEGVVKKVQEEEGTFTLKDLESEREYVLAIDDTTVIEGFNASDLEEGMKLRVRYAPLQEQGVDGLAASIRRIK